MLELEHSGAFVQPTGLFAGLKISVQVFLFSPELTDFWKSNHQILKGFASQVTLKPQMNPIQI